MPPRAGLGTDGQRPKPWDGFATLDAPRLPVMFAVCDEAAGEACPIWPGRPVTAPWGLEDQAAAGGTQVRRRAAFERAHDGMRRRVGALASPPPGSRDGSSPASRLRASTPRTARPRRAPGCLTFRAAEGLGTSPLADRLTADAALALLANTVATFAILVELVTVLGPLLGTRFNPAVPSVLGPRRELPTRDLVACVLGLAAGGRDGARPDHALFAQAAKVEEAVASASCPHPPGPPGPAVPPARRPGLDRVPPEVEPAVREVLPRRRDAAGGPDEAPS